VREDSYPDVAKIFLAKSFEFADATRDKLEEEPPYEVVEYLRNKSCGSLLVSLADAPPDSLANSSLSLPASALGGSGEPRRDDQLVSRIREAM
jgi:hypothetical protein